MNKRFLMIFLAVGMLMLSSIACEASVSTASITSVVLTADKDNPAETTSFTPDQTVYAVVTLANAPDSTKVKAVWSSVDDAGTASPIAEKELVGGGSPVFNLASDSGALPTGNFRVEILLNDASNQTIDFTISE